MSRTYEEIREQVGPISLGRTLPALVWVGNDKSLKARDEWFEQQDEFKKRCANLAENVGCDPDKFWTSGRENWLIGFTPLDPNNVDKALRPDANTLGMWVPNRRTKLGKYLAKCMDDVNRELGRKFPKGIEGSVIIEAPGGLRNYFPTAQIMRDRHVVVAIGADPADGRPGFDGKFHIDTDLYEPIPVSWLVRLSEENSNG